MLKLLRSSHSIQIITLTSDFKIDLRWFATFLPRYNGISPYDHRPMDMTLDLDAYLTCFGGRCGGFVYHHAITRGFRNWTIVHLEMPGSPTWSGLQSSLSYRFLCFYEIV